MKYVSMRWWNEPKGESHNSLVSHLETIDPIRQSFLTRYQSSLATYRNTSFLGGPEHLGPLLDEPARWNVTQTVVDTLYARVASRRPRPKMTLSGATRWDAREQARLLDRYLEGIYHKSEAYEAMADAFFDACVAGVGFVKVYVEGKRICVERISPTEVLCDDRHVSQPRTLYHAKSVPAELMLAAFPEHRTAIEQGCNKTERYVGNTRIVSDEVDVYEGWHLPPSDGVPGRHVICVEGATLVDEEWNHDWFPIKWIHLSPEPDMFFKQSIVERLRPLQKELNNMTERLQDSIGLLATAWVVHREGAIDPDKLQNLPGTLVPVTEANPGPLSDSVQVVTPPSMSSQVFDYIERIRRALFDFSPIGENDATSRVPSQLESGRALKLHHDIGALRLQRFLQRYEKLSMDIARAVIDLSKDAYESGQDVKSEYDSDDLIEVIPWSSVNLSDSFTIKVYPVNFLSETPQSKIDDLNNLMRTGFIKDPSVLAKHFDFPDIEEITQRESAATRNIERMVGSMLRDGKYIEPPEYINPQEAIVVASEIANMADAMGVDQDKLDVVKGWIADVVDMLAPPEPPPMEGEGGMAGPPLGGPAPGNLNIGPADAGSMVAGG